MTTANTGLEAKARLLDAAPLCGAALDASGKCVAVNKAFVVRTADWNRSNRL